MFTRNVLIYGGVRSNHRIGNIAHDISGGVTRVTVESTEFGEFDGNWVTTELEHELDCTLTVEQAEEWAQEQPEFDEHVDTQRSLIEAMQGMLTPEQLAQLREMGFGEEE